MGGELLLEYAILSTVCSLPLLALFVISSLDLYVKIFRHLPVTSNLDFSVWDVDCYLKDEILSTISSLTLLTLSECDAYYSMKYAILSTALSAPWSICHHIHLSLLTLTCLYGMCTAPWSMPSSTNSLSLRTSTTNADPSSSTDENQKKQVLRWAIEALSKLTFISEGRSGWQNNLYRSPMFWSTTVQKTTRKFRARQRGTQEKGRKKWNR